MRKSASQIFQVDREGKMENHSMRHQSLSDLPGPREGKMETIITHLFPREA
jgi:hypothetical protein